MRRGGDPARDPEWHSSSINTRSTVPQPPTVPQPIAANTHGADLARRRPGQRHPVTCRDEAEAAARGLPRRGTDRRGGDESGEFAFYRLDKTGWTTPDALAAVRRRWQIDFRRLSYGGLKDRHAITSQFLTIFRGPERNLTHERITLTYLGQRAEPFTSADIAANRFTIMLRAMSDTAVSHATAALAEVEAAGLPNYFDDQRFGSVGDPPEFVAREMVFGRFERALWLALAAPYEHDRAEAKREKALLRERWGDWPALKAELPRGTPGASSITLSTTRPTSRARSRGCGRSCRACISPRTRATSGTACSRRGSLARWSRTTSPRWN